MLTLTILNFNGEDTLRDSIQSVLNQTQKPDRFLVIDNASTDNSRQIAVDMGVEVVDADNRFKFITGLNTAMSLNTDLLFFMQNDVVLDRECLSNISFIVPRYSFIAQPVIYQTDGQIDNAGMDIHWPGFGERRSYQWWYGDYLQDCGLVTTICFFTNLKKHRYSEIFSPAYYEDVSFKLEYPEVKHLLVPNAKAIHKGNHTFSQTYKKAEISRICWVNRGKLIRKHYRGLDRLLRLTVSTCCYVVAKAFKVIRNWWISPNHGK